MKTIEKKKKADLDLKGMGAFLRKLADAAEGRTTSGDDRFFDNLSQFEKLSLKIKRKTNGIHLKAKFALPENKKTASISQHAVSSKVEVQQVEYKDLKKRMQANFKQIGEQLAQGRLPEADTVGSFLRDSNLMTDVPGKGEEYYGEYKRTCQQFSAAFEATDLKALQSAYARLKHLRGQAHRRYK